MMLRARFILDELLGNARIAATNLAKDEAA
jgi:hypothetical protein